MIAASSIVQTNLPCSSRISSCSDFTSGHSWRPLEAAKHYRAHGVRSLRITCAATKTAKSPGTVDMFASFDLYGPINYSVVHDIVLACSLLFCAAEEEWKIKRQLLLEKRVITIILTVTYSSVKHRRTVKSRP